jgi:hypothetical protein
MPIVKRAVELSKTPTELARASGLYASVVLETVSDNDQDRLRAVGNFFDQIADDSSPLELKDGVVNVSVLPPPEVRRRIREGKGFDTQRALAHLRTDDIEGARAQFRAILANHPDRLSAWMNAIQVEVLSENWDQADRFLAEAKMRFGLAEELKRVQTKVIESRRRVTEAGLAEPNRSLARAEVILDFGFPWLAMRVIQQMTTTFHPDTQLLRSQIGRTEDRIARALVTPPSQLQ